MNLKSITLVVAGAALFASCNQFKVTTTEDGDRYQMHGRRSRKEKMVTS
jgi:hypothetical protein